MQLIKVECSLLCWKYSGDVECWNVTVVTAETQKSVTENKFKLKKAEQEITTLQGAVIL